jgi:hypothetical protein
MSNHLRNKIGLDVALEALWESWRDRRCFCPKCDRPARRGAFAKAIATIAKENAITLFFCAESGDRIDVRIDFLTRDHLYHTKHQSHNTY